VHVICLVAKATLARCFDVVNTNVNAAMGGWNGDSAHAECGRDLIVGRPIGERSRIQRSV